MSALGTFIEKKIKVITTDGRLFVGKLEGYDNNTNLILTSTIERIFDLEEETEQIDLGLYIIRGDSVVCAGIFDEEIENSIQWTKVHGVQLKDTKNPF
ncbi:hypothetical protein PACTADRAFT_975 [Pachysolen tannophilus NRRL Y-2460]|uniref:LSM2-LSM8 complex subunit LSM8 n=1 Tax=Pachysolen tannophilus NRRL Y-2460 TaxID=669874 RepID=A0A1E4U3D0_PACTA|nr:hypothetical protein PACTADRAFT_975 [Pachysolen tannophilus NRRL Y-2460]